MNASISCFSFIESVYLHSRYLLYRVEHKCRVLPCSARQAVYGHLASYLPCTKDTLIKRAKKLRIKAEEDKIHELLKK
jgi:ubinuclein